MSIFRPWAFWRRVQYGIGFGAFWSLVGTIVYFGFFYTPASCFDNVLNGDEAGVDCGGKCTRICAFAVEPPSVVWAESFKIIDGQYNAVAYIENKNIGAATPDLEYTFHLYDGDEEIAVREGKTIIPPNSVYPIFEGRILTEDGREPTKTVINIKSDGVWLPATIGRDQFRTLDHSILNSDSRPRVVANVENTELTDARNVEIVATIFDRTGTPLTASKTFIDKFEARTSKEVTFTWPNPIAKTIRSCEVPSDIVLILDRSGSMAADGGNPPEPLESAKQAAKSFVDILRDEDLVGYLSYATEPSRPMEQILTNNHNDVLNSIQKTVMGDDGVQYTNTGDAFVTAYQELISSRHRDNARKVIVFLTDGDVTRPINPETGKADREYAANYAIDKSNEAKDNDIIVYTIGFGDFFSDVNEDVERDVDLIRKLASSDRNFYEAPTIQELREVYKKIASDICESGPTRVDVITKTDTNFAPLR
ncbi:MAG: VWA domain-containing protein [Candidatus Paceibacterota bacterium]